MPKISGVLFLLAIAATWLESQSDDAEFDPIADAYQRGVMHGRTQIEKKPKAK